MQHSGDLEPLHLYHYVQNSVCSHFWNYSLCLDMKLIIQSPSLVLNYYADLFISQHFARVLCRSKLYACTVEHLS